MGKGNRNKGNPSSGKAAPTWSFEDHAGRMERKMSKLERRKQGKTKEDDDDKHHGAYKRSFLSHDTRDKIDAKKTKLHVTKLRRDVGKLRSRLTRWDDLVEAQEEAQRLKKAEEEVKRRREEEENFGKPKKRRLKPGPETWKLRGAARPAEEVYDFDTRYVDPWLKEHEEHRVKVQRVRNVLALFRGRFGENADAMPSRPCRALLTKLARMGRLCVDLKRFKAAREALLECVELEGPTAVTDARHRLMRLYMEANRPDSARRLWERLPPDETGVWIRYSAALVEFVSWRLLKEEGSTRDTAERLLTRAVRGNVYCAYYLAFHDDFRTVMQDTDRVEDISGRNDDDTHLLYQAVEYCNSEQMGAWYGTDGALEWVRKVVLTVLQQQQETTTHDMDTDTESPLLRKEDLVWNLALTKTEEEYRQRYPKDDNDEEKQEDSAEENKEESIEDDKEEQSGDGEDEDQELDFLLYSSMFRTAMEMLESSGKFHAKIIQQESDDDDDEVPEQLIELGEDNRNASVAKVANSKDADSNSNTSTVSQDSS